MKSGPEVKIYNTLNLFAYGTYGQYLANQSEYLELTPTQRKKLQHLTLVTLATKSKVSFSTIVCWVILIFLRISVFTL